MKLVLQHEEVLASYPEGAWQHEAAREAINHVMEDAGRAFPCVFAVSAVAKGGFHYCFADDQAGSNMAAGLTEFLRNAHAIGPYASLSYVFPPDAAQTLEVYNDRFWIALKQLHAVDQRPWPETIPYSLRDSGWTFCFDGEPMFPLCLTPAHVNRRTRYATNFTISFQPRWTFKHHIPSRELMEKYSAIIRRKMATYDSAAISPYLGLYGGGHLDAEKYFFHDDNVPMAFPDSLG
jgi:uncharacterized protein